MPEVTSQEKDKIVAEWITPFAALPDPEMVDCNTTLFPGWEIELYDGIPFERRARQRWQPASFATDQIASALIRKKLREMYPHISVIYGHYADGTSDVSITVTGLEVRQYFSVTETDELEAWQDVAYRVATAK